MELTMAVCKKRLAVIWFSGGGVLFFIMFFQSIQDPVHRVYSGVSDAWGWLMSCILPTLALMISVFVADMHKGSLSAQRVVVNTFFFRVTVYLSIAYLVVTLLTLMAQSHSPNQEIMKLSHLWQSPLQGLVTASLGAFFVKNGSGKSTN